MNYTEKIGGVSSKSTYLHLRFWRENATVWMDYDLPPPQAYYYKDVCYLYWAIDGVFYSEKGKAFLDDIKRRIEQDLHADIVKYPPPEWKKIRDRLMPVELSEFSRRLNPLDKKKSTHSVIGAVHKAKIKEEKGIADKMFDAMRFPTYDFIKKYGKEALDVEIVEGFGIEYVNTHITQKGFSEIRMKAKAIYEWCIENINGRGRYADWTKEERAKYMRNYRKGKAEMTKREAVAKATAVRQERVKARIQGAINILRLYGKKITAKAIAEEAEITEKTAQKYVRELKASGAI